MTFENKKVTESKSSTETHAGLIYLNNNNNNNNNNSTASSSKESPSDNHSSPRQYHNQTRKKSSQQKKEIPSNQPQSITQSSRGLTNVTRTLYDPNAPASKIQSVSVIQPIPTTPTVKLVTNSTQFTPSPPPLMPTNTQQQIQEFHQK